MGIWSNVLNIRANYVSERPIGENTTSSKNIGVNGNKENIPSYLILHGNIGFKVQTLPMLRLDVSVENILNKIQNGDTALAAAFEAIQDAVQAQLEAE
jgi:ribosomal protein S4